MSLKTFCDSHSFIQQEVIKPLLFLRDCGKGCIELDFWN